MKSVEGYHIKEELNDCEEGNVEVRIVVCVVSCRIEKLSAHGAEEEVGVDADGGDLRVDEGHRHPVVHKQRT